MVEKMVGYKKDYNKNPTHNNNKEKPLCKFFAKGNCRNKEVCSFDHPKICYKFRSFGLKSLNEKGCDNKECLFLHPNACRDSLKSRTCHRADCRFFHLNGTKIVPKKQFSTNNSYPNGSRNDSSSYNQQNYGTRNRFEVFRERNNSQKSNDQVFQNSMPSDKITLADIMKELIGIKVRQDLQEMRSTQEDHKAWDSKETTKHKEAKWKTERKWYFSVIFILSS